MNWKHLDVRPEIIGPEQCIRRWLIVRSEASLRYRIDYLKSLLWCHLRSEPPRRTYQYFSLSALSTTFFIFLRLYAQTQRSSIKSAWNHFTLKSVGEKTVALHSRRITQTKSFLNQKSLKFNLNNEDGSFSSRRWPCWRASRGKSLHNEHERKLIEDFFQLKFNSWIDQTSMTVISCTGAPASSYWWSHGRLTRLVSALN